MAEQGCLLSSYPGKTGIGGSNPPLSAMIESHLHLQQKRISRFASRLANGFRPLIRSLLKQGLPFHYLAITKHRAR